MTRLSEVQSLVTGWTTLFSPAAPSKPGLLNILQCQIGSSLPSRCTATHTSERCTYYSPFICCSNHLPDVCTACSCFLLLNAFVVQPVALVAFDAKSNVNVARNQYDPQGNPWFGKSLNSVDFPNWGHPHQVTCLRFCECGAWPAVAQSRALSEEIQHMWTSQCFVTRLLQLRELTRRFPSRLRLRACCCCRFAFACRCLPIA